MNKDDKLDMTRLSVFEPDVSSRMPLSEAGAVVAGFPSPAEDYAEGVIDLNRELVKHPATTFYARCAGHSMLGAGIDDGDLLVVDKSIVPDDGDIAVVFIDGEFTLKRIRRDRQEDCLWLVPENSDFSPIKVTQESNFMVWGVVTYNIRRQYGR